MIEEVERTFPKYLTLSMDGLIDPNFVSKTVIRVSDQSMPWLIKVNKDRCPVCGTVEKSKDDWCDPRPESWYDSND